MKRITIPAGLALGGILVLAAPLAASAHVHVDSTTTAAGSTALLDFSLSHGCEGSPTTALTITIPDGIVSVQPTVHAGWDITTATSGENISSVTYTAHTPLADGLRDAVQVQVLLPEGAVGQTLAFPVLQQCETGQTDWSEVVAPGEDAATLESPAPTIEVTEPVAEGGHGSHSAGSTAEATTDAAHAMESGDSAQPDTLARVLAIIALVIAAAAVGAVFSLARAIRNAPRLVPPVTPSHRDPAGDTPDPEEKN